MTNIRVEIKGERKKRGRFNTLKVPYYKYKYKHKIKT